MKQLLTILLLMMSFSPLAFAATDCEKSCCQSHNGVWDYNYDDCFQPKAGYDTCVSDCAARVLASGPQGPPPASPENTHICKVGFIIPAVLVAAFLARK